jgi:hypothetical protein
MKCPTQCRDNSPRKVRKNVGEMSTIFTLRQPINYREYSQRDVRQVFQKIQRDMSDQRSRIYSPWVTRKYIVNIHRKTSDTMRNLKSHILYQVSSDIIFLMALINVLILPLQNLCQHQTKLQTSCLENIYAHLHLAQGTTSARVRIAFQVSKCCWSTQCIASSSNSIFTEWLIPESHSA